MEQETKLVDLLKAMQSEFKKLQAKNFPFTERESAKIELVNSLLKKVKSQSNNQ